MKGDHFDAIMQGMEDGLAWARGEHAPGARVHQIAATDSHSKDTDRDASTNEDRPRHLLFVCSQNRLRSPTAEAICQSVPGIEAMSAGTNNDAEQPLTGDLIEWADVVIAMERAHRNRINGKFRAQLKGKPLLVLGIPDVYDYMQPELVDLLKVRLHRWLG